MARRGGAGEGGGMAGPLIGVAVSLLVFVILEIFAPTIAGTIEEAQPDLAVTSDWNSTYNTDLPEASAVWQDNVGLGVLVILVFFIALAIYYIRMVG